MKNVLHTGSLSRALHVLKALFLNRWHIMLKSFLICTQVPVLYNNTWYRYHHNVGHWLPMTRNCLLVSVLSIGPIIKKMSTYVRHASKSSLSHILVLPFWFFIFFNSCGIKKNSPRGQTHLLPTEKRATIWPGSLNGNSSLFDITVFKIWSNGVYILLLFK